MASSSADERLQIAVEIGWIAAQLRQKLALAAGPLEQGPSAAGEVAEWHVCTYRIRAVRP